MDNFQETFQRAVQNRVNAPKKINFIKKEKKTKVKEKEFDRKNLNFLLIYFVDNFRKMVNFEVRQLEKTDKNYYIFEKDPKIPLLEYVKKIIKQTQCEWVSLPGAIILIKRLKIKHPELVISINNMHRILLIAIMIADKFLEDTPADNESFSLGSNISLVFYFSNIRKTFSI